MDNLFMLMKEVDAVPVDSFKPHNCERIHMCNVPPGPGPSDGHDAGVYWKLRKDTTMKTLVPWKISPHNCASNAVLVHILKNEVEQEDKKPTWLLADINIFTRALRVSSPHV